MPPAQLTPTQLASHLACPHLTQLERQQREGRLQIPFMPDPRLEALRLRGQQHEEAYVQKLKAEGLTVCDLRDAAGGTAIHAATQTATHEATEAERRSSPAATRRAMEAGFDAIIQAPLADGAFSGIADVLLRVPCPSSSLPGYAYEPVDTKLALQTKAGTILQLCTYAELLVPLQGVVPEHLHVVTPLRTETYRTAQFAAYHRHVRTRLQEAVRATPPPATYPHPVAHCDICRCWQHCEQQRRRDDHPSLIAGIRGGQVREFQQQGLLRTADIGQCEGQLPAKPARGAAETYRHLGQQARLQVASRGGTVPQVEVLAAQPGRGFARLPLPSVGDIFLDFEGDPFVAPQGLEYLTGYSARAGSGERAEHGDQGAHSGQNMQSDRRDQDAAGEVPEPRLTQLWALNAGQERAAFETFIDFALARVQQHPGAHIYHFGAYEPAALKRLAARHGTRGAELDQLLRGLRFVDLHTVVHEALRIGVERYGLKELEALHGFTRRLPLREAALARREVELALELGHGAALDADLRERIERYNGDDCLSTESLRSWLEGQRADAVVRGADIARPLPGEPAPSEGLTQHEQRIAALRQALQQGLPEDPEARNADERARALLAALLGYFRQEGKNAWWEFFRLRDLPAEAHLEEREMLGGLTLVERLPLRAGQSKPRARFRFLPQETAIDVGDRVVWPLFSGAAGAEPGTATGQVEAIDRTEHTVVFSVSEEALSAPPIAIFRDPVVGTKVMEESVLAFAEQVRDQGLDAPGPYAAACELLRARPPRRSAGAGAGAGAGASAAHSAAKPGTALRHPGEEAGAALARLCGELDAGGLLPVQGPPGAGKTTSGAQAILALAAAGKKIGITAVSHKVIDNLLHAVRRANESAPAPQRLHLVHKHDKPPEGAAQGIDYVRKTADALACIAPGTLVGGTAWLWASAEAIGKLDILLIDEAGQMALAQALAAARAACKLVLLGDPQQLEQPTRGAHEEGADVAALVHLLGPKRATLAPEQGLFLERTYRMHPALTAFTSEAYYEGRLQSAPGRERQCIGGPAPSSLASPSSASAPSLPFAPSTPFHGAGQFLVEVPHQGNQALAHEEVTAVVAIARMLLQPGTHWCNETGHTRALTPEDILVVAPYNAQVSALKRALAELGVNAVGTVDKFQGQEAPVVIYSCTSSSPEDAPRGMAFLYDPHRFNVATSRARSTVIVVASPRLFEPDCRTPEQMAWANGFCRFAEMAVRVRVA